ncbi:hypothetical protein HK100_003684 [Physocladia obscura]|uniref:Uncharacterized protein n=1 Tax=Physocladia obscura TaxID=109957 RepID=A0AAD5STP6_9FUNG|nr:hypothetical protein HK100_003684 [Physocladia obscura]
MNQQTINSYFGTVQSHPDAAGSSSRYTYAHSIKKARRDDGEYYHPSVHFGSISKTDVASSSSSTPTPTTVDGAESNSLLITQPFTPNEATAAPQAAMESALAVHEEIQSIILNPVLKPVIIFDENLGPKDSKYWVDEHGRLNIISPPFSSFGRKKPATIASPAKKGSKCPGFPITVDKIYIKLDCIFDQLERTVLNSYWNKQQWTRCLGCEIVRNNIAINPVVSAKRGTGVCAREMCPNDVVVGKNLCSLHQKELDDKNSLALALDKKNRPLIEALNSEFASVDVDDDDYPNKLDDYRSKLAGLLKGTKNLVSYARIDGLIKSTASNLSYRSGRILSSVQAKDFVLRVIHHGPIAGTDAFTSLTNKERENLLDLLETADIRCYWTNVKLGFSSFAGFHQFSPDRFGLQSLSYFEEGQSTAAVCLWSQRLFNDMNPNQRKNFIHLLISQYNPARANIFITNYDNNVDNGVVFGDDARKYWENKWESQSKEARESLKNTPSMMARRGGLYKVLDDIRDWGKDEKIEDSRLKGDICWVTGIARVDLMEFGGLADDRQHHYSAPDTYPTSARLNDAREADPAFHTRSSLAVLAAKHEISELQVIIKMQRQMVEALIGHWRGRV